MNLVFIYNIIIILRKIEILLMWQDWNKKRYLVDLMVISELSKCVGEKITVEKLLS